MRSTLPSIVLVFLTATQAAAALNYTSQGRGVQASTSPGGGGDAKDTNATGFWAQTASSSVNDNQGFASASASQTSNLGNLEISMSGTLSASGGSTVPPYGGYFGSAISSLSASFTLDADSPYVSTFNHSVNVVNFIFNDGATNYGANSSGVLPGRRQISLYLLLQESNTPAEPGSESGEYLYSLTIVPEPATASLMAAATLLRRRQRCRNDNKLCRRYFVTWFLTTRRNHEHSSWCRIVT